MSIENFPYQSSGIGNFQIGISEIGVQNTGALANVIPSYLYEQYSDDEDLQAFVASFNEIAQGYVDWFNSTPLTLYTSENISGLLLDWIGQGYYGISRPVLSNIVTTIYGQTSTRPTNTASLNSLIYEQSGTTQVSSDDIYKRVLTWHVYSGDGKQMSINWLRRRVARFLFGVNGSDVSIDTLQSVSISTAPYPPVGATNSRAMNSAALNSMFTPSGTTKHALQITIPNSFQAQFFQTLLREGFLAVPFQVKLTVVIQA